MEGNYTIEKARKVLPLYFYNFLKTNLEIKSKFLRQNIINTDIEKFLKGKPGLTCENIL